MRQQLSVLTLTTLDLARSKRFYSDGFGWSPVFQNEEIVFYQLNGFVLGTWLQSSLEADMQRTQLFRPGPYALGHNVSAQDEVQIVVERLVAAGGRLLREPDAPPHGYVADPDDHACEIAWNPSRSIDERGLVTFGVSRERWRAG